MIENKIDDKFDLKIVLEGGLEDLDVNFSDIFVYEEVGFVVSNDLMVNKEDNFLNFDSSKLYIICKFYEEFLLDNDIIISVFVLRVKIVKVFFEMFCLELI